MHFFTSPVCHKKHSKGMKAEDKGPLSLGTLCFPQKEREADAFISFCLLINVISICYFSAFVLHATLHLWGKARLHKKNLLAVF